MARYHFHDRQVLPVSVTELFNFLIQPQNLEQIMAKAMRVKVISSSTPVIEHGTVIDYTFQKNGIPLRWQSEITEFEPNVYFADLQTRGPFRYWLHKHILKPVAEGTEITDDLTFEPPLGILGEIAYHAFIRRDIERIFSLRKKRMEELFGKV
jgi:ligand-binding SRPBCC domain-containing protein